MPTFLSKFTKPSSPTNAKPQQEFPPAVRLVTKDLLDRDHLRTPDSDVGPNVTVIPPSPQNRQDSLVDSPEDVSAPTPFKSQPAFASYAAQTGTAPPQSNANAGQQQQRLHHAQAASEPDQAPKRSTSASNLRSLFQGRPRSRTNSVNSGDAPVPPELPRTGSGGSHHTHGHGHGRAATDSAAVRHRGSVGSLNSDTDLPHSAGGASMSPIVESPDARRSEFGVISPDSSFSPSSSVNSHSATQQGGVFLSPSNSLHGQSASADNASVYSATTGSKKRRPWRRSTGGGSGSPPPLPKPGKKPTGLAAAIAASGVGLANPGGHLPSSMGANMPGLSHLGAAPMSPPLAPRRARGGSAGQASIGADVNGNGRGRQASLTVSDGQAPAHSDDDQRSREYDSDSDSDMSDDPLLDAEDIPVTGFAVASNKRNADFHELFPGIPEADYLIEDYGCALQREILIQGRMYISENHICFHANIFGWITDLSIPMYEIVGLEKKMTAFVIPNAIQIGTRAAKYTFASFLSRDTTYDVIFNVWRLARPEDMSIAGSARPSLDAAAPGVASGGAAGGTQRKATQCACGKAGEHYPETMMDITLPGTPEKLYALIFASGFIKDFMTNEQKLIDLQISDWSPVGGEDPKLLARNMSYIKPLSGSIGPKQTRCELRDENMHVDFEDYASMVTTTRTPEVPSGTAFSVKTRTCITWASAVSTRVLVTSQVEWTGRSFIKGLIEKSCLDGQKQYHVDLERAMRAYIQAHQSEFIPEGVDPDAVAAVEVVAASSEGDSKSPQSAEDVRKSREAERNQRSLQWAYDTFEGAMKVTKQSTEGALELLKDAWDGASTTAILYILIALLVISNVYTLFRANAGARADRRRAADSDRERWVHGVVTALWDELSATRAAQPIGLRPTASGDWREEVVELNKALDVVDARVRGLRESLAALD